MSDIWVIGTGPGARALFWVIFLIVSGLIIWAIATGRHWED